MIILAPEDTAPIIRVPGAMKIRGDDGLYHVNMVGMALLGRDGPGMYEPEAEG